MPDMLILSPTAKHQPGWGHEDTDFLVFCNGVEIGRIVASVKGPDGRPWLWSITCILRDPDNPKQWKGRADAHGRAKTIDEPMTLFKAKWLTLTPDLEKHARHQEASPFYATKLMPPSSIFDSFSPGRELNVGEPRPIALVDPLNRLRISLCASP